MVKPIIAVLAFDLFAVSSLIAVGWCVSNVGDEVENPVTGHQTILTKMR